jgi:alkaline phosphatase D
MKIYYSNFTTKFILVLIFLTNTVFAQNNDSRSNVRSIFAPFYHGVASGDALSDRVIIWTRITTEDTLSQISVDWEFSLDTSFSQLVTSGTAVTNLNQDFTIKVDVTGLNPNTWYYYRFKHDNRLSLIGRAKTLPIGDVDSLRFAVASCQSYRAGFYNAHRSIAARNDLDAVIFLGDYIYEGGNSSSSSIGRDHLPDKEIITLSDYRIRHSQHKLDPDLRSAHQQYTWYCVWDDHEFSNDAWIGGAQAHDPNVDGDWQTRKNNALRAYYDWMPVRENPVSNEVVYRMFKFGNLMDLDMIDTRIIGRDLQLNGFVNTTEPALTDTNRRMIGVQQLDWLKDQLTNSTSTWKVIGQQVMMMPLQLNIPFVGSQIVNPDQWDGYPAERKRVLDHITTNDIKNMIVLTGDIHTAWSGDIPGDNYNASTGANSVGVEFVCASISSSNSLDIPVGPNVITAVNPHIKYVDLNSHGYYILDVNKQRTQADHVFVSQVQERGNFTTSFGASHFVNENERHLRTASGPVTSVPNYPMLAPWLPGNPEEVSVENNFNLVSLSVYPNPMVSEFVVQYYVDAPTELTVDLIDFNGKLIFSSKINNVNQGLNYAHFDGSKLSKGMYVLVIKGKGKNQLSKKLVKIE